MTQGGWGRDPKERLGPSSGMFLPTVLGARIHARKASGRRKALLCTLKELHKQRGIGKGMQDRGGGGNWGQGGGAHRSQGQVGTSKAFVQQAFGP